MTNIEQANPEEILPENGNGIQENPEGNPQGQLPQQTEAEKQLQAEYTRTRQALIATTVENVSLDASKLHKLTDLKLRDSVSKELYGMSYNEATAVFGANFATKTPDEGGAANVDVIEEQNKKIRLLEYKQEQANIDSAIAEHKLAFPGMWTEGSGLSVEKIREELANINSSLPIDERIKRAANISIGTVFDEKSIAYSLLNKGKIGVGAGTGVVKSKTEVDTKQSALAEYMKLRIGK